MKLIALLAAAAGIMACQASTVVDTNCIAVLRKALHSKAAWSMERLVPGLDRRLCSSGVVECSVGTSIVWRTIHPFPLGITMTPSEMVLVQGGGKRVKTLNELPHYTMIREMVESFANGDMAAAEAFFSIKQIQRPDGVWHVRITPNIKDITRLFKCIDLIGEDTLNNAVLQTIDGGVTFIRFTELPGEW